MKKDKKGLYALVLEIVSGIKNKNFRCHEIARFLKISLAEFGYHVSVRDGVVLYEASHFRKRLFPVFLGNKQDTKAEVIERVLAIHSWCEYIDELGRKIIIDWQNAIRLSPTFTITDNLIVEEDGLSPHQYRSCSFVLHNWLFIFVRFRIFSIKLRFRD